ncbi:MAG: exodeoxyribonuclease VII large subunit [Bacteroidia bacterium]|nr:exodeoxyribonuclease VII large subunit [Bacteroidia bacterium]
MSSPKFFTLSEVTTRIKSVVQEIFKSEFWIKAEINKLGIQKHSGHAYPELVEKVNGKLVAEMRATLWRSDFERIDQDFRSKIKEPLREGITALIKVRITFHELYGLSLQILDIDSSFVLGELEKEKIQNIQWLKDQKLFDLNKYKSLPLVPNRLAVISIESSQGYSDFYNVLTRNTHKYHFFIKVFPATMQGDRAVESIEMALEQIEKQLDNFDAVAIIRGGGGDVGLTCYNHINLAKKVAEFPVPVLSGIGHSTNLTVVEMVSHYSGITPTDLADFLLKKMEWFEREIEHFSQSIVGSAFGLLDAQKLSLSTSAGLLRANTRMNLNQQHTRLNRWVESLQKNIPRRISREKESLETLKINLKTFWSRQRSQETQKLEWMQKNLELLDPKRLLERGYSLTLHNGKPLKSAAQVKAGEEITTWLSEGKITSTVNNTSND